MAPAGTPRARPPLFRAEALAAHRRRELPIAPLRSSPAWVDGLYVVLVLAVVAGLGGAAVVLGLADGW